MKNTCSDRIVKLFLLKRFPAVYGFPRSDAHMERKNGEMLVVLNSLFTLSIATLHPMSLMPVSLILLKFFLSRLSSVFSH